MQAQSRITCVIRRDRGDDMGDAGQGCGGEGGGAIKRELVFARVPTGASNLPAVGLQRRAQALAGEAFAE